MAKPAIGFIGLGIMGSAMVERLQAQGYALTVCCNRSRENVEAAVARGATEARPRERWLGKRYRDALYGYVRVCRKPDAGRRGRDRRIARRASLSISERRCPARHANWVKKFAAVADTISMRRWDARRCTQGWPAEHHGIRRQSRVRPVGRFSTIWAKTSSTLARSDPGIPSS